MQRPRSAAGPISAASGPQKTDRRPAGRGRAIESSFRRERRPREASVPRPVRLVTARPPLRPWDSAQRRAGERRPPVLRRLAGR